MLLPSLTVLVAEGSCCWEVFSRPGYKVTVITCLDIQYLDPNLGLRLGVGHKFCSQAIATELIYSDRKSDASIFGQHTKSQSHLCQELDKQCR